MLCQLFGGSARGDAATLHDADLVGSSNHLGSVPDNQHRAVAGQLGEGPLNLRGTVWVGVGGSLVQNQDGRVGEQCPGDNDALLLPARKVRVLADDRVQTVRQLTDVLPNLGAARGLNDPFVVGIGYSQANVIADASAQNLCPL